MRPRALWQVSVATSSEAEDAVSAWLEGAFAQPACAYADVEGRLTTVTVWLGKRPDWSRARRLELAAGLRQIGACGLDLGLARLRLVKLRRQNWAQSWKRHFRPLTIGSALLLKPSWSRRRPRKGQAVVVLDPGLSFGTGHHPTTAFCLEQLVARRRREGQSFLDAGFGSGILAIAAAKLGYAPIEALDSDAEAIGVARANARRNRVSGAVRFRWQDLARLPRQPAGRYSLVCANLTAELLLAHRQGLIARLEPGGVLVLAGILKTEFPKVRQAFEAAGLGLAASGAAGQWRSGVFGREFRLGKNLAATYSRRSYTTTTIGKAAFDGRVRNGNGSGRSFMATKKSLQRTGSLKTAHRRNPGDYIRELKSLSRPRPRAGMEKRSSRTTD